MSIEFLLGLIGSTAVLAVLLLVGYCIRCALDDWLWDLRRRKDG